MGKVNKNKDQSVETLRGCAIILVVMGHVIGYNAEQGLKVADDSAWRHLYYSLQYLRMPLFTVISGWVYALRPVTKEHVRKFMLGKSRRLIFPMIFVVTLYYLTQVVIPGTSRDVAIDGIFKIYMFPYDHFWYLPSLFIVFIAITVFEYFQLMKNEKGWLTCLGLSLVLLILRDVYLADLPNYFSFKGALYLLPFFLVGLGIKRFEYLLKNKPLVFSLLFILVAGLILQQLAWYGAINKFEKSSIIGLLIGITGTVLFFKVHIVVPTLSYIGGYSYSIYLFHVFGTAGSRIFLNRLGITEKLIVFIIALIVGILIPIIAELILDRFNLTRLLFLGRRFGKSKSKLTLQGKLSLNRIRA